MDAKVTLSFNQEIIKKAKAYASDQNISLSRLAEFIFSKMIEQKATALHALPISDWVQELATGDVTYNHKPKSRKELKDEFMSKEYIQEQPIDDWVMKVAEERASYKKNSPKKKK